MARITTVERTDPVTSKTKGIPFVLTYHPSNINNAPKCFVRHNIITHPTQVIINVWLLSDTDTRHSLTREQAVTRETQKTCRMIWTGMERRTETLLEKAMERQMYTGRSADDPLHHMSVFPQWYRE